MERTKEQDQEFAAIMEPVLQSHERTTQALLFVAAMTEASEAAVQGRDKDQQIALDILHTVALFDHTMLRAVLAMMDALMDTAGINIVGGALDNYAQLAQKSEHLVFHHLEALLCYGCASQNDCGKPANVIFHKNQ